MIELLKLAACLPFLLYSSYTDLTTRRVPNRVWKLMLLSLSGFVLYEAVVGGTPYILHLLFSFFLIFALTYLLFKAKVFGGADMKALVVLAILVPVYPTLEFHGLNFPLLGVPPIKLFALTVLENALFLTAAVPLGLFCYNLLHFNPEMLKKPLYMLIAYRVKIKDLRVLLEKGRHLRLAERFEFKNGKLKPHFAGSGIVLNSNVLSRLEAHEENGLMDSFIWVTPGLPFMVPITAGFIMTALIGDLIFHVVMKFFAFLRLFA
ncbi:peptidase A24 [Methanosarcina sp. KYL-1]|uniref:A24 family peptidase C-terminal domain-containing protein n=1 Tax=Methanosarcina sp. KYL-1 TaxID=2602068 RepID=UPI002100D662|nr:A24 family peptidase C-terminal domain-containing protein [Methanosarcina sp. KYL-1]MCQ1535052.1 peptidase A24 [Methanosarcina sp. KYL-1]